jgi:hypothetical protein
MGKISRRALEEKAGGDNRVIDEGIDLIPFAAANVP